MKRKNIDILEHIAAYCEDIEATIKRFGKDEQIFNSDRDYRNSICMSLLQIGELTGHLTDDFREQTKDTVYWPAIKGMRNLFAHNYNATDIKRVWNTALQDVPQLHEFCNKTIQLFNLVEQEIQEPEEMDIDKEISHSIKM